MINKDLTYGEIYKEFIKITKMSEEGIDDYRPCVEGYGVPNIPNAIVIWLKNKDQIIYIKKGNV